MRAETPRLPAPEQGLITKLRQDLLASDWTVATVERLLGTSATEALGREQRVPALVKLRGDTSPAACLTKVFILGEAAPLEGALPNLTTSGARKLGLIDALGTPLVDMRPHAADLPSGHHEWWVASDRCEMQTGLPLRPEHVLGIGPATLSLLRMTVRRKVGSALDLGTGCGIQALYLTTHAKRVVATDISPRACAFARFNAALNNAPIEVRQGSLFEPVRGESFDLVTSNPPFVITPNRLRETEHWEYRDSGMDGDDLIQKLVKDGPTHLRPGGLLQLLANWQIPVQNDTPWYGPFEGWLEEARGSLGGGLAAWVVLRDRLDVPRYAELWLRDSGGNLQGRHRWEADYQTWLEDFAASGIEEVGMGFVAVRREETPGIRLRADSITEGDFPDGEAVVQALDYLTLPAGWLDMSPVRASDVREARYYLPGEPDPEIIQLTQGGGMGRVITVSSTVAALIGTADGELTVRQIATALAAITDRNAEQVCAEVEVELPIFLRAGFVNLVQLAVES